MELSHQPPPPPPQQAVTPRFDQWQFKPERMQNALAAGAAATLPAVEASAPAMAPLTRRASYRELVERSNSFPAGSEGARMLAELHELELQTRRAKASGAANYKDLKHAFYDCKLALRLHMVNSNFTANAATRPDAVDAGGRRRRSSDNMCV